MFHLRLLLILASCGLLVQPVQAEPVDSLAVEAESVDSYFLNDRAITRIPTKVGLGALTAVGSAGVALITYLMLEEEPHYLGPGAGVGIGLLVGYPLGVYLADPVESSFWMTCVGYGLIAGAVVQTKGDNWLEGVLFYGSPIMASELSRLLPKRYRNPNPFKWLFGKFRRPSSRVSFALAPTLNGGLSTSATLHF